MDMVNSVVYASQRVGTSWKQTVSETWASSPIAKLTNKEKREFINHITVGADNIADNMIIRGLSASLQNYVGDFTRNFKNMASLKAKIGEQSFKALVEDHRFSERDLKLLSIAEPESFKGKGTYLTDQHIYNIAPEKISDLLKTGENAERVISDLANKYRTLIWSTVQEHARGSVGASMRDTKYVEKRGLGGNLLRLASQFLIMPISFARTHLIDINHGMVGGGWGISANVYRAKVLFFSVIPLSIQAGIVLMFSSDYIEYLFGLNIRFLSVTISLIIAAIQPIISIGLAFMGAILGGIPWWQAIGWIFFYQIGSLLFFGCCFLFYTIIEKLKEILF
ncbi:hypothetical protein AP064_04320 [Candidatus Liberibacter solanacearum]|uniref:hypothetical protein n=1 Tax=Candidatus Liberibacter solanacearum TaxID=556287 RepID=UPI0005FA5E43|nr:hypothetical protein [Candidatus Liberibacter solanacearum]KJZ81265.1 hypothetical protein KP07_02020 [Candidatus Liberibacter solanacearum]KQC49006.1 hypothetical protein AP064_04320 [Candidatus Liberibacter solanacearum]